MNVHGISFIRVMPLILQIMLCYALDWSVLHQGALNSKPESTETAISATGLSHEFWGNG